MEGESKLSDRAKSEGELGGKEQTGRRRRRWTEEETERATETDRAVGGK